MNGDHFGAHGDQDGPTDRARKAMAKEGNGSQEDSLSAVLFGNIVGGDSRAGTLEFAQSSAMTSFDWIRFPMGAPAVLMTKAQFDRLMALARGKGEG